MALADNQVPTRENCDLTDPEERFLWMLTGLPDVVGALLLLATPMLRKISAHLVKCGAMLECPECGHQQEPEIRFRMTPSEVPMTGAAGEWVPADQVVSEQDAIGEALVQMRPQVQRMVAERLADKFPDVFSRRQGDVS